MCALVATTVHWTVAFRWFESPLRKNHTKKEDHPVGDLLFLVDSRRFELPTPTMRMWCAPNCATSPYHKNYTAGFSLCQGKRNPCTQFQLCDIINKKTVRRKQYVPWRRLPWLFFEYHWFGRTVRPCNFAVTAIHMPAATQVRVAASFINWNLPY